MNTLDSNIKSIAEDCAYSFKGLYKQSDIKEKYTNLLILFPLSYSVVLLVFPDISGKEVGKIFSIITLIFSFLILIGNKSSENITKYRELANEYKKLYDKLHLLNGKPESTYEEIKSILDEKNALDEKTSQYPIGFFARILSKTFIRCEMDLKWLD